MYVKSIAEQDLALLMKLAIMGTIKIVGIKGHVAR
jgi:hypothetical protein